MQTFIRFFILCCSPYLICVYWRNSMREIDNLHAHYDLTVVD